MANEITITLGEGDTARTLAVPKLKAAGLKRAWPAILRLQQAVTSPDATEHLGDIVSDSVAIIHAALVRTNPGLSFEEVLEEIDPLEAQAAVAKLLAISGFAPVAGAPSGKA